MPTGRRVVQDDWDSPRIDTWIPRIIETVAASPRPAVLVAHSLGVPAIAFAAARMPKGFCAGAFMVAPADFEYPHLWPPTGGVAWPPPNGNGGFEKVPLKPFPFPSVLVASTNDGYCSLDRAKEMAGAWGSKLIESGDHGHINVASGHGPWPEGLLHFGGFLKTLG